jgi:hypothetical protein
MGALSWFAFPLFLLPVCRMDGLASLSMKDLV